MDTNMSTTPQKGLTRMANPLHLLVELTGFEPATYALRK